jgi:hypothetical protein
MLTAAEAKLTAFGDIEGDIVRYRADKLKRVATEGGEPKPDLTLPSALLARQREHGESREHLAASRVAHEGLVAACEQAASTLRRCEQDVASHACAIVVAEASQQATALEAAWDEMWHRYDLLCALSAGVPAGRLPPDGARLLQRIGALDERQHAGGRNPAAERAREVWRRWYATLLTDAEATFEGDVALCPAQQKVA